MAFSTGRTRPGAARRTSRRLGPPTYSMTMYPPWVGEVAQSSWMKL